MAEQHEFKRPPTCPTKPHQKSSRGQARWRERGTHATMQRETSFALWSRLRERRSPSMHSAPAVQLLAIGVPCPAWSMPRM